MMKLPELWNHVYQCHGFSDIDYRVLTPDLRVVCTTKDLKKAQRIAEQCGGTVHPSKETSE